VRVAMTSEIASEASVRLMIRTMNGLCLDVGWSPEQIRCSGAARCAVKRVPLR